MLDGGVLSYYLSAEDVRLGCRGSVHMALCSLRGEGWAAISHVAVCVTELISQRLNSQLMMDLAIVIYLGWALNALM